MSTPNISNQYTTVNVVGTLRQKIQAANAVCTSHQSRAEKVTRKATTLLDKSQLVLLNFGTSDSKDGSCRSRIQDVICDEILETFGMESGKGSALNAQMKSTVPLEASNAMGRGEGLVALINRTIEAYHSLVDNWKLIGQLVTLSVDVELIPDTMWFGELRRFVQRTHGEQKMRLKTVEARKVVEMWEHEGYPEGLEKDFARLAKVVEELENAFQRTKRERLALGEKTLVDRFGDNECSWSGDGMEVSNKSAHTGTIEKGNQNASIEDETGHMIHNDSAFTSQSSTADSTTISHLRNQLAALKR
ncbi:hypothetical protein BJ508DRAFT_309063 [Ascobolus immersus RN42]|uniref:Uncharacterized protein n=1 Tax=Ascobolus immersus RN42 TaxID=1160509 RepID=A0A3N4I2W9_ASCIM|nr:hypothetical protein BJ508DRAFT_309063 [Ascobolus immersus RN42]